MSTKSYLLIGGDVSIEIDLHSFCVIANAVIRGIYGASPTITNPVKYETKLIVQPRISYLFVPCAYDSLHSSKGGLRPESANSKSGGGYTWPAGNLRGYHRPYNIVLFRFYATHLFIRQILIKLFEKKMIMAVYPTAFVPFCTWRSWLCRAVKNSFVPLGCFC